MLDLVAHWPKHVFLLALLAAALAGWRRMVAAAGIASAAAATSLALVLGLGGFALPQAAPADARLVRVVSANVHGSMAALEQLALQAKSYGADIVSAHEVPDDLTTDDIARLSPICGIARCPVSGVTS